MASANASPARVGPSPRTQRLIHLSNRVIDPLLRSPLHRPMSNALMLVEFTGRKSGRRYRAPVGYTREGDVVSFHIRAPWWKNLRGGAPIAVWLKGERCVGIPSVVTDDDAVARVLGAEIARAPRLARFYNVRLDADGRVNADDLARLARGIVLVNVTLTDEAHRHRGDAMRGKVVLVTGANSGIGKATALALARMGATLVMVARDRARGEAARDEIIAASGNPSVELLLADLSSQEDVRRLARDFLARHNRLHVLVHNAGVFMPRRVLTADGLEATFATNHLAPFLLTDLLLPALRAAAPARVVNVASGAQLVGRLDFTDLQTRRYRGMRAYANSKLALITWTYELARRLTGTGVTANAVEPGIVDTKIPGEITPLFSGFARRFMSSPERGARTSVSLASAPEAEGYTGNFFSAKGAPIRSARPSYDRAVARRLWEVSARLTGLPADPVADADVAAPIPAHVTERNSPR